MNKRIIIIISAIFCCTALLFAQPGEPGETPPITAPVPIDGGLITLLIAGAAYGGKKLLDKNKKEKI